MRYTILPYSGKYAAFEELDGNLFFVPGSCFRSIAEVNEFMEGKN